MDYDLVMVMGGPIGVSDARYFPFLKMEMDLLRQRIEAGKVTAGICLGAQLMAAAMGGDVYKGETGPEIGWGQITLSPDALGHPARHICQPQSNMFHVHGDTFSLPEGAALIASSTQYPNQIFEIGTHALGLQCHPEVTETSLEEWYVMMHKDFTGANAAQPIDMTRNDAAKYAPTLVQQNAKFFTEWLERAGL